MVTSGFLPCGLGEGLMPAFIFYQTKDNPLFFLAKKQMRGVNGGEVFALLYGLSQAVPTGTNADAIWATLSFRSKAAHQCGLRPLSAQREKSLQRFLKAALSNE